MGLAASGPVWRAAELRQTVLRWQWRTVRWQRGPKQTQFISNKWVGKYSLHEPWKGFIPYYVVFGRDTQLLEQWFADEAEYARQQQLWLQAFPPPQRHEVDVRVK
jgi:hypothetical protein